MKSMISCLAVLLLLSCDDNDLVDGPLPDPCVTIINDLDMYRSAVSDGYSIVNATINNEGCLSVTLEAGGCDGMSWTASMVQGDIVIGPDQAGVQVRVLLIAAEDCLSQVMRDFFFDVEAYQSYDYIVLQGYDQPIIP